MHGGVALGLLALAAGAYLARGRIVGAARSPDRPPVPAPEAWDPTVPRKTHWGVKYDEEVTASAYVNHDLGLSLENTNAWTLAKADRIDPPGKKYEGTLARIQEPGHNGQGAIITLVRRDARGQSPLAYAQSVLIVGPKKVVEAPREVEINGAKGAEVVYTIGELRTLQCVFVRGADAFVITAAAREQDFDAKRPALEKAIAGFRLN